MTTIHFNSVTKFLHYQDLLLDSTLRQFEQIEIINLKYSRFTLFNKLAFDWTFTDAVTED
jgi:hypothetical protein